MTLFCHLWSHFTLSTWWCWRGTVKWTISNTNRESEYRLGAAAFQQVPSGQCCWPLSASHCPARAREESFPDPQPTRVPRTQDPIRLCPFPLLDVSFYLFISFCDHCDEIMNSMKAKTVSTSTPHHPSGSPTVVGTRKGSSNYLLTEWSVHFITLLP